MWIYATWAQVRVRDDLSLETRTHLASRTAENVRRFVTDTHRKLHALAADVALREMLESGCTDGLALRHAYLGEFQNIYLARADGTIICSAAPFPDELREVAGRQGLKGLAGGPFDVGHPQQFGESLVTIFAVPLVDDSGGAVGYVGLAVDVDRFQQVVDGGTLPVDAIVTLAHRDGTVIARSLDPEQWVGRLIRKADSTTTLTRSQNGGSRAATLEGRVYDWVSHDVFGSDWEVYAGLPKGWAVRSSLSFLLFGFVVGGLLLFGVALAAARLYGTVGRHLRRLVEDTRAAAEGAVRLDENGLEEVAEVARALNSTLAARNAAEAERKALEEQVLRSQKLEAVGRLAGAIAHDFNNRLAVISGQADLLREQFEGDAEVSAQLSDILDSAERAAGLTAQLLTFSRRDPAQKKVFDLNELIRKFEPVFRNSFKADIGIVATLHTEPCPVMANRGQLEQVVMNLANNARDAMPDGGRLSFTTRQEAVTDGWRRRIVNLEPGAYVVLSVSDTGIGMDAETRSQVFEPFFTTKVEGKGTGLGLSSAYGIVQQHGGAIQLYSSPSAGTSFEIWLPLVDEPAVSEEAESECGTKTPVRKGTILLAEDQATVRRMISTILTRANFDVLEARDGLEAVKIGRENADEIDAMVTDWIMPGLRGPAAAEKLKESNPDLPVLFISGYTDEAIGGVANQGIPEDRFLAKPFTREQLLERMDALLSDVEALR
jgi:signal transduction histidine kinase/CheY-like chemotaxis protein